MATKCLMPKRTVTFSLCVSSAKKDGVRYFAFNRITHIAKMRSVLSSTLKASNRRYPDQRRCGRADGGVSSWSVL